MSNMLEKLRGTLRFLRYGPTQLDELRAAHAAVVASHTAAMARQAALDGAAWEAVQRLGAAEGALDGIRGTLKDFHGELAALAQAVPQKAADVDLQFVRNSLAADLQRETGWLRDRVGAIVAALDQLPRAGQPTGAAAPLSAVAAQDAFYPALEQQFRGTRAEIRDRLAAYREWVSALPPGPVGDLGCGRGEWLELLREWGLKPVGVDVNSLNVDEIRGRGFDAVCADALEWLRSQPDNAYAALTSFHVVEHLPLGVLLRLVEEARRVLVPGGRLILETPNPENLGVATQSFWLDPTHQRPLPPPLLEFIVVHAGFEVEATPRLNPPAGDGQDIADATLRSLMTRGRDYAVVARKPVPGAAQ